MLWTLYGNDYSVVAQVPLPSDTPDVVMYKGCTFYYSERDGDFIETHVHVIEA